METLATLRRERQRACLPFPDEPAAELATTRARGYGVCPGELESSLYGWGPRDRVKPEEFAALGAVAVRAAAEISATPAG